MHPYARGKVSDYKMRLLEKQKLRYSYWVSERQFRRYVKRAIKQRGIAGENLLRLLERRIDNLVYRLGFATSIPAARQLVVHGHILVNAAKVDRPSYSVRPGEGVSLKESSRKMVVVQDALIRSEAGPELSYVKLDKKRLRGSLIALPTREEIPLPIDEGLVVEYYAKYI